MENILTSIIERLEDNRTALGLSYIDEEYGQVDILDDESRETYPVTFPAVLIDAQGVQWQDLGNGMQKGSALVNVNVYIDCYDDTHAYSTTISKVDDRIATVRGVNALLQGWEPDGAAGSLRRVSSATSTNNHGIKLYQATFSVPVYESFRTGSSKTVQTVKVTAAVIGEDD